MPNLLVVYMISQIVSDVNLVYKGCVALSDLWF